MRLHIASLGRLRLRRRRTGVRLPSSIGRRRIPTPLVLAGFVLVAVVVSTYVRHVMRMVENAYAVWNVAEMVVIHLERNDGRWPKDWEDLRPAARIFTKDENVDLAHWQEHVVIDFSADPRKLAAAPFDPAKDVRPFDVIRNRHWPRAWYTEPNVRVWMHLRSGRPETGPSMTRPATAPAV